MVESKLGLDDLSKMEEPQLFKKVSTMSKQSTLVNKKTGKQGRTSVVLGMSSQLTLVNNKTGKQGRTSVVLGAFKKPLETVTEDEGEFDGFSKQKNAARSKDIVANTRAKAAKK